MNARDIRYLPPKCWLVWPAVNFTDSTNGITVELQEGMKGESQANGGSFFTPFQDEKV